MSRGIRRAAALLAGFNAGYDTLGRVQLDREMRQAANEQPVTDAGFTDEQGQQLQAAAASGQYDIEFDQASGAYKVKAKADPNAVGTIAPGQRTTFGGKTVAGTMDDGQVNKARQLAMAGVLERNGQLEAAGRMRDRVAANEDRDAARERARKAGEREDWRFEREQKKADDEDAYKQGMTGVFEGTVFGQRSKAFREAMSKYEAEKKAYDAKVAAGEDAGLAPTMPAQPTMTSTEKLLDAANVIGYKAQHGRATPEEIAKLSDQMVALQQEGYTRFLQVAQSGAPLTQVVAAFNGQGKVQIDPASIIEDKTVTRDGGVKSRLITWRSPDGRTQTIDTAAGLTELGKIDELLKVAQQAHTQRIQEGQLAVSQGNLAVNRADAGRRAADFNAGAPGREAAAEIARLKIALAKTEDPAEQQKIEAKLRALSTGARSGGGASAGADPAKVKEAQTVLASGLAADLPSALELVMQQPDKMHADFVKTAMQALPGGDPTKAVGTADKVMASMGWRRNGNRWTKVAGGGGAKPANESDAHKQARAAIAAGADKNAVNARLKQMGYAAVD